MKLKHDAQSGFQQHRHATLHCDMKLVFGAGGTGGHIIPAIALALEMRQRGHEVCFIGNRDGMESRLVTQQGFIFHPIQVQKIYRQLTMAHLKFPYLFIRSLFACLKYLRQEQPAAVLCTGGFVSGPVALAARILHIALYFQDGNSYPGLTTRLMAKHTRHIFIASESATKYLPAADCLMTGNPILAYDPIDRATVDWQAMNLSPDKLHLFVIGGSQGSAIINHNLQAIVSRLLAEGVQIIWQTGKQHKPTLEKQFRDTTGVHIFDFTDKMSFYYQIADLAISRAGALSIAELQEHRIPAIYVPLPTAAENHQYINALACTQKGASLLLEQKKLSPESLLNAVKALINSLEMQKPSTEEQRNHATQAICDIITGEICPPRTAEAAV
jgi:UDP-N-acetylglucosamine--N-acetylmuramyl-(pentapeptide) pyrophosphoryl-undecaprenol N-acetylglucosamine transferase